MFATRVFAAFALVATLAACGQTAAPFAAGARPVGAQAVLAKRSKEDMAKKILEEELNQEGETFGEVDEIHLLETADANVFSFVLVKSYQDDEGNMWEDRFAGTVDVKRKKVKAKRTRHEEV
jgi:hypothetical protein